MWRCPCVPRTVYDFLAPFTPLFRGSQARYFVIFCWLVVAIIRDPGAGTLKGLCPYLPPHLSYWALLRMLRSGQWDAHAVMTGMADQVLRSLPPAVDGKLYLIGDTPHKPTRGRKPPLGHVTRQRESAPYTVSVEVCYVQRRYGLCRSLCASTVVMTLQLGTVVLGEATLSFLGLGAQPPAVSWGQMLSGPARRMMEQAPWLIIFPTLAISMTVLAINFLGDTLRDIWDPKLRGSQ